MILTRRLELIPIPFLNLVTDAENYRKAYVTRTMNRW